MKKENKATQQQLFEMLGKLDSNYKQLISENQDKWIQNAVNPEHKGFCTPENKPSCTPRRKALANRFKKGVENENANVTDYQPKSDVYKEKIDKIKKTIDDLYQEQDYNVLDTIYRLFVSRKGTSNPTTLQEDDRNDYGKKVELLKGKIDFLYDNKHTDIIDKIDDIVNKLFPDNEPNKDLYENNFRKQTKLLTEILHKENEKNKIKLTEKGVTAKTSLLTEIISKNKKKNGI